MAQLSVVMYCKIFIITEYFFLKHQNFEEQMQGMKTQLIQLSTLLRLLDSGFCSYLGELSETKLYSANCGVICREKKCKDCITHQCCLGSSEE